MTRRRESVAKQRDSAGVKWQLNDEALSRWRFAARKVKPTQARANRQRLRASVRVGCDPLRRAAAIENEPHAVCVSMCIPPQ